MEVRSVRLEDITPYERNPRKNDAAVDKVAASIREFGFQQPIVCDAAGVIIVGHTRYKAAQKLGLDTVPVVFADLPEEKAKAYRLADNKTGEFAEWDLGLLDLELGDITGIDMTEFGFEPNADGEKVKQAIETLAEAFIVPPLSILDVRQGYWQERKKAWKALIQDNGEARGGGQDLYASRTKFQTKISGKRTYKATSSVLDPVMCEVMLTWFMPKDGKKCFDCFAGDSVFGFVSGYLGYEFTGIELREEQAAFNQAAVDAFGLKSTYYCDDGRNVRNHIEPNSQDFFFSCPPYYDMEVYSDKENDASNQGTYEEFYAILDKAFTESCACLKKNRFAVVCCQDVRNKKGTYYNFPNDIIATFERNGFSLYNRIILIRSVGSASLFARSTMNRGRKVRSIHEDVLVFFNGDETSFEEADTDDVIDSFYAEFLKRRQNIDAFDDVLVFFNGKPDEIKKEFAELHAGGKKHESEDV